MSDNRRGLGGLILGGAIACAGLGALAPARAGAEDFQQSVPAEPGGTLRVRLDAGSVQVEAHAEDAVRVDARTSGAGAGRMDFDLRREAGVIELVGRAEGLGLLSGLLGGPRIQVRVRVPEAFNLDVETRGGSIDVERLEGSIRARTSGGTIGVEGARGPVDLHTSGGSIRAESVEGDLQASTSGGAIRASEVAGQVEAETSGGSITLSDVRGPVRARTSGGSVSARFRGAPAGSLETSGGTVEVSFPADAALDLDARTSGGRIEVEHPILVQGSAGPSQIAGRINGGGPTLRLRTSGGNIHVQID